MTERRQSVLAWFAFLVTLVTGIGTLGLLLQLQRLMPKYILDLASDITYVLIGLATAVVGAFVATRRPENVVSWIMLGGGLALVIAAFTNHFANLIVAIPIRFPGALGIVWLSQWSWLLPYLTLALLFLFYPMGRLPSRRWRWVLGLIVFGYLALAVWLGLEKYLYVGDDNQVAILNPIGVFNTTNENAWMYMLAFLFLSMAAGLLALALRYRRAQGIERQQMRWLTFVGAVFVAAMIPDVMDVPGSNLIINIVSLGVAFAIGIAVLRYRLWDIDNIIRRTTSYAIITFLLGLIYFGSIVAFQSLFGRLTGQDSTIAVVLSTLLIAALFFSVRRRVQDAIDRRFFRRKYDAEKTLEAFAATFRNEPDLDALTAELLRVIQETMQPATLSMWLRPSDGPDAKSQTSGPTTGVSAEEV